LREIREEVEENRGLGPGTLEGACLACLCVLLTRTGLRFEPPKALPLVFEGVHIARACRADLFVEKAWRSSKSRRSMVLNWCSLLALQTARYGSTGGT
jgi:hypothetical protein